MHIGALYHALNNTKNPNTIQANIVSNLPTNNLPNISNTNNTNLINIYKDNLTQAFVNTCENVRWLSIQNNCQNPNDYVVAWSFLGSLSGSVNSITGLAAPFSCNNINSFGRSILYKSISNMISNTCVQCVYNLNYNTNSSVPYSESSPYKNNSSYGTNITHSITSMGDPCAVGSFISCTYICK